MKKEKLRNTSFDAFCAIFQSSYFTIEDVFNELQTKQNQEEELIRKELLLNLSEEAKFVVQLVLSSPREVFEALSAPNYKRPTRESIRKYLVSMGFAHKVIDLTYTELKEYAKEINF